VPSDTKARFVALAARHQLSESSLLAKMVDEVLKANSPLTRGSSSQRIALSSDADTVAGDRITLRLRPGDRSSAAKRAHARGMKTGSYLALLIHNHVRGSQVLPPSELDQIRTVCAHLAALGRQLQVFGMPSTLLEPYELGDAIVLARREVKAAREATAAVVRSNLISWETSSEVEHA